MFSKLVKEMKPENENYCHFKKRFPAICLFIQIEFCILSQQQQQQQMAAPECTELKGLSLGQKRICMSII
jgi:hypothetical protein